MKKMSIIISIAFIFSACATYKKLDLNKLTFGMTTEQVIRVAGSPNRVLSARQTEEGYQEVLEFRTAYDEVYALEFWNDYLTGYEYLYEDVAYVAPVHPPTLMPEYGRPIYIINNYQSSNRPNRPNRPSPEKPNRPDRPNRPAPERPGSTNRPSTSSRPETGGSSQSERPAADRPGQSTTSRPSNQSQTSGRGTTTRQTDTSGSSQSSGRSSGTSSRSSGTRTN